MKKKILAGILAVATLCTCAFTVVACKDKDKTEQAGTSLTQIFLQKASILFKGLRENTGVQGLETKSILSRRLGV